MCDIVCMLLSPCSCLHALCVDDVAKTLQEWCHVLEYPSCLQHPGPVPVTLCHEGKLMRSSAHLGSAFKDGTPFMCIYFYESCQCETTQKKYRLYDPPLALVLLSNWLRACASSLTELPTRNTHTQARTQAHTKRNWESGLLCFEYVFIYEEFGYVGCNNNRHSK